jgi:hypothetical protein
LGPGEKVVMRANGIKAAKSIPMKAIFIGNVGKGKME